MNDQLLECFVCASGHKPLYRICVCDSVVHEECYKRLINVPSHSTHCAVCRTPYNITIDWKKKTRCNMTCALIMTTTLSSAVACMLTLVFVDDIADIGLDIAFKAFVAMAATCCFCFAMWIAKLYKFRTNQWCCILTRMEPIQKTIHLPAPEVPLQIVEQVH